MVQQKLWPLRSSMIRLHPSPETRVMNARSPQKTDVWTVQAILRWTRAHFENKNIDTARLDAELLLAHVLKRDRIYLYTHYDQPLSDAERSAYRALVIRRAAYEPVAYLLGYREFYGRSFAVNSEVLIPRPESEHLVERVLQWTKEQALRQPRILDVGCGSGNIAITLACELNEALVVASDLSSKALLVAQSNAKSLGVEDRIRFIHSDLFAALSAEERFDIVVSNPPYVETAVQEDLQPDVRNFEPPTALFGGEDGLDTIRRLCRGVGAHLNTPGLFACELGAEQFDAVHSLLKEPYWHHVQGLRDLQGHLRVISAQRLP